MSAPTLPVSRNASTTFLLPQAGRHASIFSRGTASLSPELLGQSLRRLRVLVVLYAFIFFMAGFFPALLFEEDRAHLFAEPGNWVPGAVSITVALLVWAFTLSRRVPLTVMMQPLHETIAAELTRFIHLFPQRVDHARAHIGHRRGQQIRCISSTSGSPATAGSITSWNCWMVSTSKRLCESTDRYQRNG